MSEKITFKQLVELISSQAQKSQDSTNSFLHELVQIIETGLRKKGAVSISGFGKFELRWMKERTGINPQTGEEITIPAQNKVVFKPYKSLRDHVNRSYAKMEPQILDTPTPADDSEVESAPPAAPPTQQKQDTTESAKPEPEEPTDQASEEYDPFEAILGQHRIDESESEDEDDSDDEFVMERAKPEQPEPAEEPEAAEEDPFTEQDEEKEEKSDTVKAAAPLFVGTGKPKKKSAEPEKEQDLPDLRALSEDKELAEKIKEAGSFNWSYAAAAIAAALLIAVLIFMMMRPGAPVDETIAIDDTPPAQVVAPADQAVYTADAAADPPDIVPDDTPVPDTGPELFEYEIQQGESLWSIAEAAYGNPYLWPAIYQLNLDTIDDPNRISSGQNIVIPSIQDAENLTGSEQEMVAEGYISIYNWALSEQPDQSRYFLWAAGSFSPDILDKYNDQVDAQHLAFARRR